MFEKYTLNRPNRLASDDRAVSEVLGAILVFALIILLLVLIQANAVPAANKQVEFEHNNRVTQDFQSLQEGIARASTTGSDVAVSVETGVTYPPRFFLLNPAPSTGTLSVTNQQSVTIRNSTATGNVGDYWNPNDITYDTRGITYRPSYNELANAGTFTWEHSMLYRTYDNNEVIYDDPTSFIDGREIRLTLLEGSYSRGAISSVLEIAPVSTAERTITLGNATGSNITIELQTELSDTEWRNALDGAAGEPDPEPYAQVLNDGDDTDGAVTIELTQNVNYELSVSKLRVGTTIVDNTEAKYITDVSGNETNVDEGTSQRLTVEVRDQYNNPVSNAEVTPEIVSTPLTGESIAPLGTIRTNNEGQATFTYTAPDDVDDNLPVDVLVEIGDGAGTVDSQLRASFDLTVVDSDSSGSPPGNGQTEDGVSGINPGADAVKLTEVGKQSKDVVLTFQNDAGEAMTLDQGRLLFYLPNNQESNWIKPTQYRIGSGSWTTITAANQIPLYGGDRPITPSGSQSITIPDGGTAELRIQIESGAPQDDFFGLSISYEDGSRSNYFVVVP